MLSACTILHKRSSVSNRVPALTALQLGELAINTNDGKIFTKTDNSKIVSFLDSSKNPYVLDLTLSAINTQYGTNNVTGVLASVLNGFNNDVSGSGSTVANGEDNDIASDFSFIGSGLNNKIALTADYGAILGGSNNNLNHANSFIIGTDVTSHAENFTYVNNLSVLGKIYGDGSSLQGVAGGSGGGSSEYLPLSGGTVTGDFQVSGIVELGDVGTNTALYITNQLVGVNTESPNEALTVAGSISASSLIYCKNNGNAGQWNSAYTTVQSNSANWIGGNEALTNLISNSAAYLSNVDLSFLSVSADWNSVYTTFKNTSSTFLTSETDSQTLNFNEANKNLSISNGNTISLSALVDSAGLDTGVRALSSDWQNALTTVQTNSASWAAPSSFSRKFDMVYSPSVVSYSGVANSGSLTSQSVWTITKITYSTDGTISTQTTASNVAWDNRSSISYS